MTLPPRRAAEPEVEAMARELAHANGWSYVAWDKWDKAERADYLDYARYVLDVVIPAREQAAKAEAWNEGYRQAWNDCIDKAQGRDQWLTLTKTWATECGDTSGSRTTDRAEIAGAPSTS